MMAVINQTNALGHNYCHHHALDYVTPVAVRTQCSPIEAGVDSGTCVRNAAGMNRPKPWQGLDCSNYVAFVLNLAFGYDPTGAFGQQACSPELAPGRLLNTLKVSQLDQLLLGDLVYITLGLSGRTPPVRVSHVVMWTGLTADLRPGTTGPLSKGALVANLPASQQAGVLSCIAARQAKGLPVYVISDSHHSGPNLRPFCGWYINSFSHARRLIDPSASLPVNDASVAYYDAATGACMSRLALQG